MFENRKQAGRLLARSVVDVLGKEPDYEPARAVVIGLPRGGVPVALEVALALGCQLDVLVSKKIGAPGNSELAVGAVSSDGIVVTDEEINRLISVPPAYLEAETGRLADQTRCLEQHWLTAAAITNRPSLAGKWTIVVDDGVATGMTTLAALRTLQLRGVGPLVLATPVMAFDTFRRLRDECDRIVALLTPYDFNAVGQYYRDFHQVGDEEVIAALRQGAERAQSRKPVTGGHLQ